MSKTMTDLQALLDVHQSTRLLRLSFPRNDGLQATLIVNRFEGTEYPSRDFEITADFLSDDAGIELEAMHGKALCVSLVEHGGCLHPFTGHVASFRLVKTNVGMVLFLSPQAKTSSLSSFARTSSAIYRNV